MSMVVFPAIKIVRWSGWPLLPLVGFFLFTGYILDGRFGLSSLLEERAALVLHRVMHLPLIFLMVVHSSAALYVTLQRWGWCKRRCFTQETRAKDRHV